MIDTELSPFAWWEARRLRYNIGLCAAGILAFIAYAGLGSLLLSDEPNFEVTLITTLFQGIGYLLMMGLANLCFFLGPLSEKFIFPLAAELPRYRQACFRLGFWFSVLLPFSIPALIVVSAMVGAHHGN